MICPVGTRRPGGEPKVDLPPRRGGDLAALAPPVRNVAPALPSRLGEGEAASSCKIPA
jgi:hypothetical protein